MYALVVHHLSPAALQFCVFANLCLLMCGVCLLIHLWYNSPVYSVSL